MEDRIIIEFLDNPKSLKKLFSGSSFSRLEVFDYPFPIEESDFNGMFYQCTELTYVDFTYFSFENTTDVSGMFNYCKKLTTVIFPQNSTSSNIENFMEMFAHAESLTSINLTYFSFVKAKNMTHMFNGCNKLSTIILPKENNTSTSLQEVKYMFYDCKELTSIDLSGISFLIVKDLSYMFYGCNNLETLILPTNEKVNNVVDFSNILYSKIIYNKKFYFL